MFCIFTPNSIHFSLDLSETCWKHVFHPGPIKQDPVSKPAGHMSRTFHTFINSNMSTCVWPADDLSEASACDESAAENKHGDFI